jgi:membrane protein DedA with SNARE-associated domain
MNKKNNTSFIKYAAMAIQILVAITVAVYAGSALDNALAISKPFSIWLLPLLLIAALIIKIIRDTSTKK